jgi:hypothetical protein
MFRGASTIAWCMPRAYAQTVTTTNPQKTGPSYQLERELALEVATRGVFLRVFAGNLERMDAATYDAKLLAAAMLLGGAPEAATRKVHGAFLRAARVSAPKSGTPPPLGARAWFEIQSRIDAARQLVEDAARKWSDDLTDTAKETIRKAVRVVEDAIEGARDAAGRAGSAAKEQWDELKRKADDVATTIGLGLGAFAGGTGLVVLAVLFLVLSSASGRARPREFSRFVSSRGLRDDVRGRWWRCPRAPEARTSGRARDPAFDLDRWIATTTKRREEIREEPRPLRFAVTERTELQARDGRADDRPRFRFDVWIGFDREF